MTADLIAVGDRVFVDPRHVKLISWKRLRDPHTDLDSGVQSLAAVLVETDHDSHFIPCRTKHDAVALALQTSAAVNAERAKTRAIRQAIREARAQKLAGFLKPRPPLPHPAAEPEAVQ